MKNPVDDYLLEKAGGSDVLHSLRDFGIGTAVVAGASLAAAGMRKAYYAMTKNTDFNRMLDTNPDLRAKRRQDPKAFNAYYSSLRSLNPRFASDPVVAGTYMHQMMEEPFIAGKTIVESLSGAKGLHEGPYKLPAFKLGGGNDRPPKP